MELCILPTVSPLVEQSTWWRHQMKTFSVLLALCAGNSPVTGEFPSQRPVTPSFDTFFDLRLNKRLNKQSRRSRFETPSRSLWRHRNEMWHISAPNIAHLSWSCWTRNIWLILFYASWCHQLSRSLIIPDKRVPVNSFSCAVISVLRNERNSNHILSK